MKSDSEILKGFEVGKQGEDLIFVKITESEPEDENNGRQADLIAGAIMKIVNENPKPRYNFLVDLTLSGTVSHISEHAKKVYIKLSGNSNLNKAAIVGHNLMLEIAVNLLMQASGRGSSFKWFSDLEEAKNWLKMSK